MKKNIFIYLVSTFALNANAAILIYDGDGNKQDIKYLENHDAIKSPNDANIETKNKQDKPSATKKSNIPYPGELTKDDLKTMTKADFNKYIKQIPDENRPIEKQKLRGLGTAIIFIDIESASKSMAKTINDLTSMEDDGLRIFVFLKQPKTTLALNLVSIKFGTELKTSLKIDPNNKNARRLHVSSYPQIIYLATDGSKARYAANSGGLTALKMKIGEVKTMLELKERQKQQNNQQY